MYYELYIDVLFLINFMMDSLLLLLVKTMLKCSATHRRIFFGAAMGAFLTCIVVVLPIPYAFIKLFLFHAVVNACMIQIGLKLKSLRTFVQAILLLYIGSFLMGGIIEAFRPYVKMGSLFFAVALAGYYVSLGVWNFVSRLQKWNQCRCEVKLYFHGQEQCLTGLIDTGNSLSDPVSGQPVSIIGPEVAKILFQGGEARNIRYIPYRTIGNKEGILPVFRIDKLEVRGEKECSIEAPLIGISEEELSAKDLYKVILNPNLF